jgi:TATA-box binding protein (TBP) (component of TFIID and TFIIIB)
MDFKMKQLKKNCDKYMINLHKSITLLALKQIPGLNIEQHNEDFGVLSFWIEKIKCSIFENGQIILKGSKDEKLMSAVAAEVFQLLEEASNNERTVHNGKDNNL